jgi:hypothetical protein
MTVRPAEHRPLTPRTLGTLSCVYSGYKHQISSMGEIQSSRPKIGTHFEGEAHAIQTPS